MPADLTVLGLGHLGLPAARAAVSAGLATLGWDPDPAAVAALTAGRSPIEGVLTTAEVRRMLAAGFVGTTDPGDLDRVRVALLCSPTAPGS
ncbi:nucleotide sugar dehydrogenase, partial [Streptomyces calidiresistens]|nr:nucleotide sugar dehydrogenase [Streptomyces calidiresistens]